MAYDVAREQLGPRPGAGVLAVDRAGAATARIARRRRVSRARQPPARRRRGGARRRCARSSRRSSRTGSRPSGSSARAPHALRGRFAAALRHPPDGAIQPARWVRSLARLAAEAGAEFAKGSRVDSLDELDADRVVVATDGLGRGLVARARRRVRPTRGQVIVTEPLPKRLFERPHYARHGFDYWHQTRDGRLVVGGLRDAGARASSPTTSR